MPFRKSEAVRVCEAFNGLEPGSLELFGEDSGDIFHPFRDLYYAGLLGVIQHDPELGITLQRFRRPHDSLTHEATELPESPFFLLHPALDTFIRTQRTRRPFLQFQHVPVGDNLLWQPYYPIVMQVERQLQTIEDHQFVDLTHKLVKRVQSLITAGRQPFARTEIETSNEWRTLCDYLEQDSFAETLFWLEELIKQL